MIAVTGFSVILGVPFGWSLLLFCAVTLAYTFVGGIRAVIWTDCVQALVFISAGLAGLCWLLAEIGPAEALQQAAAAGRLEVFRPVPLADTALGWINDPQWFATAVLFGFLSTVAALGTDQDMAQRLLSSRTSRLAKRSLIASGFIAFPVAALFLFLGVLLYVHFQINPDPALPMREAGGLLVPDADKVFSHFMTTAIPAWLRGLLLTGVLAAAMSSLDSTMAALTSSAVRDLLQPLLPAGIPAARWLWISRAFTVLFALVLMAMAWLLRDSATFLWLAFKITSLTYGSLLGVFLLGRFSRRGSDRGNLAAMLAGTAVAGLGLFLVETGRLPLAWTWLLLIGTLTTVLVGLVFPREEVPPSSGKYKSHLR
jgi:Na+/proline symporter